LIEIALQLIGLQEFPGAFQYDIATEIAPRHFGGRARVTEADLPIADQNGAIVIDSELLPPAAVQAVELEEVSGSRGSAFDLIEVHHIQPIARAGIVGRSLDGAKGRSQGEPADASHSIDSNTHALTSLQSCSGTD
jgi:hypothetical protein